MVVKSFKILVVFLFLFPSFALAARDAEITSVFRKAGVSPLAIKVILEPGSFICGGHLAIGCYHMGAEPNIRIAQNLAPRDFEFALLHELGHHLTAYSIPKEEWEAAANKFANSKMTPVFKPRYSFKKLGTYKLNIK